MFLIVNFLSQKWKKDEVANSRKVRKGSFISASPSNEPLATLTGEYLEPSSDSGLRMMGRRNECSVPSADSINVDVPESIGIFSQLVPEAETKESLTGETSDEGYLTREKRDELDGSSITTSAPDEREAVDEVNQRLDFMKKNTLELKSLQLLDESGVKKDVASSESENARKDRKREGLPVRHHAQIETNLKDLYVGEDQYEDCEDMEIEFFERPLWTEEDYGRERTAESTFDVPSNTGQTALTKWLSNADKTNEEKEEEGASRKEVRAKNVDDVVQKMKDETQKKEDNLLGNSGEESVTGEYEYEECGDRRERIISNINKWKQTKTAGDGESLVTGDEDDKKEDDCLKTENPSILQRQKLPTTTFPQLELFPAVIPILSSSPSTLNNELKGEKIEDFSAFSPTSPTTARLCIEESLFPPLPTTQVEAGHQTSEEAVGGTPKENIGLEKWIVEGEKTATSISEQSEPNCPHSLSLITSGKLLSLASPSLIVAKEEMPNAESETEQEHQIIGWPQPLDEAHLVPTSSSPKSSQLSSFVEDAHDDDEEEEKDVSSDLEASEKVMITYPEMTPQLNEGNLDGTFASASTLAAFSLGTLESPNPPSFSCTAVRDDKDTVVEVEFSHSSTQPPTKEANAIHITPILSKPVYEPLMVNLKAPEEVEKSMNFDLIKLSKDDKHTDSELGVQIVLPDKTLCFPDVVSFGCNAVYEDEISAEAELQRKPPQASESAGIILPMPRIESLGIYCQATKESTIESSSISFTNPSFVVSEQAVKRVLVRVSKTSCSLRCREQKMTKVTCNSRLTKRVFSVMKTQSNVYYSVPIQSITRCINGSFKAVPSSSTPPSPEIVMLPVQQLSSTSTIATASSLAKKNEKILGSSPATSLNQTTKMAESNEQKSTEKAPSTSARSHESTATKPAAPIRIRSRMLNKRSSTTALTVKKVTDEQADRSTDDQLDEDGTPRLVDAVTDRLKKKSDKFERFRSLRMKSPPRVLRGSEHGNVLAMFKKRESDAAEQEKEDVFSKNWKPPKFDKNDPKYGRPKEGSLTEKRGIAAGHHIGKEIITLCEVIHEYGWEDEDDGTCIITFGKLFDVYQYISDKVVGMLLRARKHKLVFFEGEMLYQRRDERVPIILLKTMAQIRAKYDESDDPALCLTR